MCINKAFLKCTSSLMIVQFCWLRKSELEVWSRLWKCYQFIETPIGSKSYLRLSPHMVQLVISPYGYEYDCTTYFTAHMIKCREFGDNYTGICVGIMTTLRGTLFFVYFPRFSPNADAQRRRLWSPNTILAYETDFLRNDSRSVLDP